MKKVALAGAAHIHTPSFANTLKEHKDIEIAGVWDHNEERARKNAAFLNTKTYGAPEEIWNDPSVDAVVVCSETNLHKKLVLPSAAAGKHLFVEKPLGFSARDAFEMAEAIEKAGVIFQTGYFMRGNPVHLFLKEQIEKGVFGKITRIRHTNCHSGSLGGWFDTEWRWMADPSIAGCGAFGDLGTHSLDILMWFMGVPVSVTAYMRVVTGRYGSECDESGEGLLQFPCGAVGTLAGGWVDVANPITCEISGTEGHACMINGQLFFRSSHVPGADGQEPWTSLPEAKPHAFVLFLDALSSGSRDFLVPVREAAQRNAVMEAMYWAGRNKNWKTPEFI